MEMLQRNNLYALRDNQPSCDYKDCNHPSSSYENSYTNFNSYNDMNSYNDINGYSNLNGYNDINSYNNSNINSNINSYNNSYTNINNLGNGNNYYNHNGLKGLSNFSTFSTSSGSSSDDLLPDLWEPENAMPQTVPELPQPAVMLRDASLEYAQSLLPHSLLAPLTEENLDTLNEKKKEKKIHTSRQGLMSLTSSKGKSINTQLYKTELCVLYLKMGVCPYGVKCQFAHGNDDLKRVERPANWRSKPCTNWAKYGLCRYGKRCCFKHGD